MNSAAQNGTDESAQARTGTEEDPDEQAPPGGGRRRPFNTLDQVRRELSRVYHQQKDGRLDMDTAKGRAYLLSQIVVVLKAESSDGELAALLAQLRDRVKGGRA